MTPHGRHLGGGLIHHAGRQRQFDRVCAERDPERVLRRAGKKLDENVSAPMRFRLDPHDPRRIGGPHELAHGIGQLGAQRRRQQRREGVRLGLRSGSFPCNISSIIRGFLSTMRVYESSWVGIYPPFP